MTLKEQLERLKTRNDEFSEFDWDNYKKNWIKDVKELEETFMSKWFSDLVANGLANFDLVNEKRYDFQVGEYTIPKLEMTLVNEKYLVLDPISSITTEFDGRVDFYMLGNYDKKVSIIRSIKKGSTQWLIGNANLHNPRYSQLTKAKIESFIEKWLK